MPRSSSFGRGQRPANVRRQAQPHDPAGAPHPATARGRALELLAAQARRFPDLAIASVDDSGLDPRDAALAHALYDVTIRRWLTLRFLLRLRLKQDFRHIQPELQAVLLMGAAQLLFMDRVPAHAAISESVGWAKRRVRPGAGGLVNAVLRRVAELRQGGDERTRRDRPTGAPDELPLEDGSALVLTREVLPEDFIQRLSIATSVPDRLLRRWQEAFGKERTIELAMHALVRPPVVLNVRWARDLPADPPLEAHASPGAKIWAGSMAELSRLLDGRDDLWVQDAGSAAPAALAEGLQPATIADLCAGMGTKTRQLMHLFPRAAILATDVDAERFAELRRGFPDGGRVRVVEPEALLGPTPDPALPTPDLVLLDVPCTNTGVLPRRLEAAYRFNDEQLQRLVQTQRGLLRTARGLLAPGGRILYATCSLEIEECEAQAKWAQDELGLDLERIDRTWPAGAPGDPPARYRDASFAAMLAAT